MTVRVERDGQVTIVTIDRPEVRNAVDGPTAEALADAFRSFAADDGAHVAVLTGAGGTFCAGADLTAMLEGRGNRVTEEGDGPTRIRCPACGWEPSRRDLWMCACLHSWNTFETRGICPGCGHQWLQTACPRCKAW